MTGVAAAAGTRLERWTADRVADRLWAKDGTLWAESGKAPGGDRPLAGLAGPSRDDDGANRRAPAPRA